MENLPQVGELQGTHKESQMGVFPGKLLLQFPGGSPPNKVAGLILLLILGEELLIHTYKK